MAPLKLHRIRIAGFRSLRDVSLELSPITVVIGPNGSGKSNLLSALRMISLIRTESLRRFTGEQGGASALLHYGANTTPELALALTFVSGEEKSIYTARLGYAAGDSFIFLEETAVHGRLLVVDHAALGAGHVESRLTESARNTPQVATKLANDLLEGMGFFHFHDTSSTSPLRQNSRRADSRTLHSDGANLASFLYALKTNEHEDSRPSWNLINGLVRRVAPFIKELVPDLVSPHRPDQSAVRLYWKDERDHLFDVSDLSDGTLRAIALFTALGQPTASRPQFITIDEPELGLHPAAVGIFAALVRSVSQHCQILLATQSPALLDEFEPEDVVVTERSHGETTFRRLDSEHLAAWLDDYSLSDLYDKNVLGGRP
jgi:predicted ATPase